MFIYDEDDDFDSDDWDDDDWDADDDFDDDEQVTPVHLLSIKWHSTFIESDTQSLITL